MNDTYFVDEKGIFSTEKVHGDVEYRYWVYFNTPGTQILFNAFCEKLRLEGGQNRANKIMELLR